MALAEVPAISTHPVPASGRSGSRPDLSIVIVNWSTREDLLACLGSLGEAARGLSAEVVVVDNASSDGSAESVEERFPAVQLIRNRRNAGFARANNQAFAECAGRYILLLNPDTIANAAAFRGLLDFMEGTPGAGAAGLQLRFPDGRLQNSYDSFPTFGSELISKHLMRLLFPARYPSKRVIPRGPLPVDIVIGACLILRREVVEALGGFDERYFLFVEEADLCFRIRRAGWGVYHLPDLSIVHDAKASKAQATAHAYIEYARSTYRFYRKSMSPAASFTLRALKAVKVVLLNPLLSLLACAFTLGRVPRHRRRLRIRAHLCAWHLLGCPSSWGMRQVSPLRDYRRSFLPGRETIVALDAAPRLAGLVEAFSEGGDLPGDGRGGGPGNGPGAGPALHVEVYRPRGLLDRLRALREVPEGILFLERAQEARDRGIPALSPRAAGAVRRSGLPLLSFAVFEGERALRSLDQAIPSGHGGPRPVARLARFLRRLHDAGIDPGAGALGAVSFREGAREESLPDDDDRALLLSDPRKASFGPPLGRGERILSLRRLAASAPGLTPAERRRFLSAYFRPRGRGSRRPLRALHLFSNHKLTGPAETALDAARAVDSLPGATAEFVAGRDRDGSSGLRRFAVERGARVGDLGLDLKKHFSPLGILRDVRRLRARIRKDPPDLIHCHLGGDHLTASLAAPRSLPIVRSLYDGAPPEWDWRARRTLGARSARVICFSEAVRSALLGPPYRLPPDRVARLDPPIDTVRFDPGRPLSGGRAALGISEGDFTVGIAARLQTHRRFEVLFEAVALARREVPALKLVVIGRGTHADSVAREPVRRLGLESAVRLTGYLSGEEYVAALAALDASVFLVPGSDGTCRAVREALSMGLPVIAARRGMLPELVRDGETGLLVDDRPEALAAAVVSLARDPGRRSRLSAAAREDALARFSHAAHAEALLRIYRSVLSSHGR